MVKPSEPDLQNLPPAADSNDTPVIPEPCSKELSASMSKHYGEFYCCAEEL